MGVGVRVHLLGGLKETPGLQDLGFPCPTGNHLGDISVQKRNKPWSHGALSSIKSDPSFSISI